MTRQERNLAAAVLLSLCAFALSFRAAAQTPAGGSGGSGGTVATVAGRRISRADYDRVAKQAIADYERLRGSKPTAEIERLIQRQALERLIRAELLEVEGLRKVKVTEAEIDAAFRSHPFFNQNGAFNAARYQQVKAANAADFRASVAEIRAQIAGRKLAEQLQRELTPAPEKVRTDIERRLSRATLEYFALRLAEFDGSYVEPRESEILEYYRAHEREFARVQRAALSVIQIGDAASPQGRAIADSLIAEIREGLTFEGASSAFGGVRAVRVSANDFPSWWSSDPAAKAELWEAARKFSPVGAVLQQPYRGRDGWLIVRVDAFYPAGTAPLRDVSREIRRLLREDRRTNAYDRELRAMYESRKSMLKDMAYRVRFAAFDTAAMAPGEPSAAETERYYRGHLADFGSYDPATAKIRTRSLDEVRDDVKSRWRSERRVELARQAAAKLEAVWRAGRRDRALEAQAAVVKDAGPMPLGVPADTGYFGRIVGDSLAGRAGAIGTGLVMLPRGSMVFHVHQAIRDYIPSYDEYRSALKREQDQKRAEEEEKGARELFDRDPQRWASGKVVYYSEVLVPFPDPLMTPLTRKEVERYHIEHLDRYSATEQLRARHILVSPEGSSPEADAAARQEAEQLLQRVRAGEDIAELARRYSDDPPTQAKGGDLGFFGRGVMLEEFERAAFALKVGDVSEPVRTQAGWHVIKVIDHLPLVAEPLEHVYSNVGADAATEKGEAMTKAAADSMISAARSPAHLRTIAKRYGYEVLPRMVPFNEFNNMAKDLQPTLRALATLKPGEIVPRVRIMKGHGALVAWLDSVGPAREAQWEVVRDRVLDAYRLSASIRALYGKRAELDSLQASGWSLDSIATMLGGYERVTDVAPGKGIVGLGGVARVDSLVFGDGKRPSLSQGQMSDWVELSRGVTRVRLVQHTKPGVNTVAARAEAQSRLTMERSLQDRFTELSRTHRVVILDPVLRETTLPPIPESLPEPDSASR